ncbi:MAG: hypothetical protein ACFFAU_11070 [Candidatus Hodarchaeota archaeon]
MNDNNHENDDERTKLKNVTIRGIDADTYEEFSHKIRNLQMNLGDAITRMMQDITKDLNDSIDELPGLSARTTFKHFRLARARITHHDHLSVGKKDLEEAGVRFSFSHIGELTILPDVTREDFRKYIRSISHCDRVRIPAVLPKLLMYSKINFCDKIEVYEVDQKEPKDDTEKSEQSDFSSNKNAFQGD